MRTRRGGSFQIIQLEENSTDLSAAMRGGQFVETYVQGEFGETENTDLGGQTVKDNSCKSWLIFLMDIYCIYLNINNNHILFNYHKI